MKGWWTRKQQQLPYRGRGEKSSCDTLASTVGKTSSVGKNDKCSGCSAEARSFSATKAAKTACTCCSLNANWKSHTHTHTHTHTHSDKHTARAIGPRWVKNTRWHRKWKPIYTARPVPTIPETGNEMSLTSFGAFRHLVLVLLGWSSLGAKTSPVTKRQTTGSTSAERRFHFETDFTASTDTV